MVIVIPIIIVALIYCGVGVYIQQSEKVLPFVSIGGVNVSWLSYGEVVQALDLQEHDLRGENAKVSIVFPDGSELNITGADVRLNHEAQQVIASALSSGRGRGFVMDLVTFLDPMNRNGKALEFGFALDKEFLRARASVFTQNHNNELENSNPVILDDRIILIKGAGRVRACEFEVYEMALEGLFESLDVGQPVRKEFVLPDSGVNADELVAVWREIFVLPQSAEYDPESKTITDCVVGVDIDLESAVALLKETQTGMSVSIDKLFTPPEVTRDFLERLLFRDLIGETITSIEGSEYRLNNIILSSDAVNGLILEPGEEFSFNEVVGRRTWERGYRPAPAFSGGLTVDAIGGGICQVSSSIFSSILDSDILVTERFPHGRPVAYLPRERDATVSWGTLDFKFVNNTEYPLRIDSQVDDRTLTVRVFGTLTEGMVS